MSDLDGRVAAVSGDARAKGRGTVRALSTQGASGSVAELKSDTDGMIPEAIVPLASDRRNLASVGAVPVDGGVLARTTVGRAG